MKLIKINTDHYVVVDDSEIREGDYCIDGYDKKTIKKITHSTQPFEKEKITNPTTQIVREAMEIASKDVRAPKVVRDGLVKPSVELLSLQEVKELIGEVDVDKKAVNSWEGCDGCDTNDELFFTNGYQRGYNQAIEDNKEKKYTEEDVISIVEKSRETGLTAEYLMLTLQPKTEWEVEMVDGKLKLL